MRGSKYDDVLRERALAMLAMPKMNAGKVAAELGIPRATVYDWKKTAEETDPDFVAVRRNKIRAMMDKSYSIVGRTLNGLEKRSKALELENSEIERVIERIAADGELDGEVRETMEKIVRAYTGTGMAEMTKVMRDTLDVHERLESRLAGGTDESAEHEVHVQLSIVDPAEKRCGA